MRWRAIWALLWLIGVPAVAQSLPEMPHHTYEVYLERDINDTTRDQLSFIDILTGRTITAEITGERYTPVGQGVMFFDPLQQQVMLTTIDGGTAPHPFIEMTGGARRVDWVVSSDGNRIAWTLTYGVANALTTVTTLATVDGADRREIFRDGPREGIRALPVALDAERLYMDSHPDGLSRFMAYRQYAGLFSVDVDTGTIETLPGEPACFCGAGLSSSNYLRLALGNNGFDVRAYFLPNENARIIPAIAQSRISTTGGAVIQAGDVRIAPDGTRAIYALSEVRNFGALDQTIRSNFILIDLVTFEQRVLTTNITTYVRPVYWTEDNSAIIFTSARDDGTWKLSVPDGAFVQVARATYIGELSD